MDTSAQTRPYNSMNDSLYHPAALQTIYHAGMASINFCYFFLVNITLKDSMYEYFFVFVIKKGGKLLP